MKLTLDKIRLDGGTQPRAELLLDVINEYAEQMRGGAEFPRVIVFFDGQDYWLADGFHRVNAAKEAFPDEPIDADVHQGSQSDAQWYSYSVNQIHGLRRTNEDKQRAVKAALLHPLGARKSDRQIAEHIGAGHALVSRLRKELESTVSLRQSAKRTGKDGRTINTSNIGKGPKNEALRSHSKLKVRRPIRAPCPVEKLTTVNLPHNPIMGARTLLEVFPADYLKTLVEELQQALQIS